MTTKKTPIKYEVIKELIENTQDPLQQALVAVQYGIARRVGELVRRWHKVLDPNWVKALKQLKKENPEMAAEYEQEKHYIGYHTEGILIRDIEETEDAIIFHCPNFKNKHQPYVRPFVVKEERWLYDIIRRWYLQRAATGAKHLFPCGFTKARVLISEALKPLGIDPATKKPYSSHHLRHSRATHLVEIFEFSDYELKEFLGHAKLETSATYVHASQTQMRTKMKLALAKNF